MGHVGAPRLGVIGYGAIVRQALDAIAANQERPLELVACLARPSGVARARAVLEGAGPRLAQRIEIVTDADGMAALKPNLVAEAAGHEALRHHGVSLLAAGIDLLVTSTGALADENLNALLRSAAARSGARMSLCAGAIGALDLLAAARLSGGLEVAYTSRKPPRAWKGTPAEALTNLESLTAASVFYEGTARQAARDYPQNANVAATIALAGAGLDATRVRLIADPAAPGNIHEIAVRSSAVSFELRIEGKVSPANPKTSLTTGYALAADILQRLSAR